MNIILMKVDALRLMKTDAVDERSTGLGKATPTDYHGTPLITSILLVSVMEHMVKSASMMESEEEGEETREGGVGVCGHGLSAELEDY